VERDPRWPASLQLHLKTAIAARNAGDSDRALASVDAALAIDPSFTAARMLRESIAGPAASGIYVPADSPEVPSPRPKTERAAGVASAHADVLIAARTQRSRIEERLGAARGSIGAGRFTEATAALLELVTLDPALPAIPMLAAELNAKRNAIRRRRRAIASGVAILIASAAVGVGLGLIAGNWPEPTTARAQDDVQTARVEESAPTRQAAASQTEIQTATQLAPAIPAPTTPAADDPAAPAIPQSAVPDREQPTVTARRPDATPGFVRAERDVPSPTRLSSEARRIDEAPPTPAVTGALPPPPAVTSAAASSATAARAEPPPLPEPTAPASPSLSASTAPALPIPVDDAALIRETLQRYRRAYNGLDARLAHAVYPGVDEAALAHAFEGLHSQSLEFDSCALDTREDSARAVCRGSARYVPKVGSRAPRSEPRVWTFRLNKDNGDWKITAAWTDR
jgi:hypothetical protein